MSGGCRWSASSVTPMTNSPDHPGPRLLARRVGVGRRAPTLLRADGHDVTAPAPSPGARARPSRPRVGRALADQASRRSPTRSAGRRPPGRAGRPLRRRRARATPRPTSRPRRVAAMVYVDTGPANGRARRRLRGRRAPAARVGRPRREPRRHQRGAARRVPRARRSPEPGNVDARRAHVHQRRPEVDPDDGACARAFTSEEYKEALEAGYSRSSAAYAELDGHHLDRPADVPLADVVQAAGAGRDPRARCDQRSAGALAAGERRQELHAWRPARPRPRRGRACPPGGRRPAPSRPRSRRARRGAGVQGQHRCVTSASETGPVTASSSRLHAGRGPRRGPVADGDSRLTSRRSRPISALMLGYPSVSAQPRRRTP